MTARFSSLVIAGAPDDTGNLGVTALNRSILASARAILPAARLTVLDYGSGAREDECEIGDDTIGFHRRGHRSGRRYYKTDNLATMMMARRMGLRIGAAPVIETASAVLDVGGGDSFTDLYGVKRFRLIADLRRLVLRLGAPLVLMPQTYGPFSDLAIRDEAADIVDASAMAWARDDDGFEALKDLMGPRFDPTRQRVGVDVAFGLPARRPREDLATRLEELRQPGTVGLNVSGLVFNDPEARRRFGHRFDYPIVVMELVRRLLESGVERIVLVPHVHAPPSSYESDRAACDKVIVDLEGNPKVVIAPDLEVDVTKWLIAGFEWFCGTRMHATIAALSSGVPCATIAYSLKARGVFSGCDMAHCVADAREVTAEEAITVVMGSYHRREADRPILAAAAANLRERAAQQMKDTFSYLGMV